MNPRKLAVELYSLREYSEKDFIGVLRFVAETGYLGVEPAVGLYGLTPREFKHILDDLGLEVKISHYPSCRNTEDVKKAAGVAAEWGGNWLCCGFGKDDFKDVDSIRRTADLASAMIDAADRQGMTMLQHNHFWEFERIDGRLKYDIYLDYCPRMRLQLDTFWAAGFGAEDPVEMLRHFAGITDSIHVKDGDMIPKTDDKAKVAQHPLGTGDFDLPAIVAAIPERIGDIIVELDRCSIDMREGIAQSYRYMTANGLGRGSR